MITFGRFASTNYSGLPLRRRRRRLMRLVFYWIFGSVAGGLLYLVAGVYLPLFI